MSAPGRAGQLIGERRPRGQIMSYGGDDITDEDAATARQSALAAGLSTTTGATTTAVDKFSEAEDKYGRGQYADAHGLYQEAVLEHKIHGIETTRTTAPAPPHERQGGANGNGEPSLPPNHIGKEDAAGLPGGGGGGGGVLGIGSVEQRLETLERMLDSERKERMQLEAMVRVLSEGGVGGGSARRDGDEDRLRQIEAVVREERNMRISADTEVEALLARQERLEYSLSSMQAEEAGHGARAAAEVERLATQVEKALRDVEELAAGVGSAKGELGRLRSSQGQQEEELAAQAEALHDTMDVIESAASVSFVDQALGALSDRVGGAIDRLGTGLEACNASSAQLGRLEEWRAMAERAGVLDKIAMLERGLDVHEEWQAVADGQMATNAEQIAQLDTSLTGVEEAVADLQNQAAQSSPPETQRGVQRVGGVQATT